jgi:hypothetical protein
VAYAERRSKERASLKGALADGGYAGLAAGAGWMKEASELLGVPFEVRGRLPGGTCSRNTAWHRMAAFSLVPSRLRFLGARRKANGPICWLFRTIVSGRLA